MLLSDPAIRSRFPLLAEFRFWKSKSVHALKYFCNALKLAKSGPLGGGG